MRRRLRSQSRKPLFCRNRQSASATLCVWLLSSAVLAEPSGPVAPFSIPSQLSGYVQVDYVHSAESRDQLNDANQLQGAVLGAQGQLSGSTGQSSDANALVLNQNRFLLRRARLRAADQFAYKTLALDYVLQVDANSIAGLALSLRDAEAGLVWSPGGFGAKNEALGAEGYQPLRVRLGAGLFRSPFGYDVYEQSHAARLFAEPSLLANAFFPGDYDFGARLQVDYGDVFLVAAVQNGEPIGARPFAARDPNSAKDLFLRAGGASQLFSALRVDGGVSFMRGTGFHPGTPPTKDTLVWRDFNEDGIAQPFEIQVIRGASATASENFERWAVGADLRANVTFPFGKLTLFGEGATGVNIDRGIRPADPIVSGAPQRAITVHGGFVQELGQLFMVGARVDHYDARIDATDRQGGQLVRANRPFTYYSFAGALRLFESSERRGRGRLMVEYQRRRDKLARDESGRPADLDDDRLTLRMQVAF
jgi:hypothetical protein